MVEQSPLIVPGLRNVIASALLSPEEIPRNMAAPLITVHCLTMRSSRDRFAARLTRYRVPPRRAATRPGLTQVLDAQKDSAVKSSLKDELPGL